MIKIEKTDIFGVSAAIRGMRNPYESHEKSDSKDCDLMSSCLECPLKDKNCLNSEITVDSFIIGKTDLALCKKLIKAGSEHRKFLRMIHVQADVIAPRYWWAEADKYKFIEANSSSTMHLITKRHLHLSDFSHDCNSDGTGLFSFTEELAKVIVIINDLIDGYNESEEQRMKNIYFRCIKQLLPESYNQLRTIDTNYECLLSIYHQRRNHRLTEWREFCDWIKSLPYMEEFLEVAE